MNMHIHRWAGVAALALVALGGCEGPVDQQASKPLHPLPPPFHLEVKPNTPGFVLTSPAFKDGEAIPSTAACDGGDRSPELKWSGVPKGTKSFCLIMTDPDAPGGTFAHWLRLNIPGKTRGLAANSTSPGLDGHNDFHNTAYGGPCPPSGEHHYRFTLYALNCDEIGPSAGESRSDLELAIKGNIIGQTTLTGTYRKR